MTRHVRQNIQRVEYVSALCARWVHIYFQWIGCKISASKVLTACEGVKEMLLQTKLYYEWFYRRWAHCNSVHTNKNDEFLRNLVWMERAGESEQEGESAKMRYNQRGFSSLCINFSLFKNRFFLLRRYNFVNEFCLWSTSISHLILVMRVLLTTIKIIYFDMKINRRSATRVEQSTGFAKGSKGFSISTPTTTPTTMATVIDCDDERLRGVYCTMFFGHHVIDFRQTRLSLYAHCLLMSIL